MKGNNKMFYDRAKIYVKAGDGGNGIITFRREKYVPDGGPNGGDGGRGGDVILIADSGLRTMVDFKYKRHYKAKRGEHGLGGNKTGASGEQLIIRVPVGTIVKSDDDEEILADLVHNGQKYLLARGGRGGHGNAHFLSNTHKAPHLAENGEPGKEMWINLELKLMADVGLVGLPNVGKSSLISVVSAARPKIADYPFTTLVPNLGVVKVNEASFVLADIPGLIEGAHQGAGLGHEFLRHVERTRVLIHVLDVGYFEEGLDRDPYKDFLQIQEELRLFNEDVSKKPLIIAANKMDLLGADEKIEMLRKALPGIEIFPISAHSGAGVKALMYRTLEILRLEESKIEVPVTSDNFISVKLPEKKDHGPRFEIVMDQEVYVVKGAEIERHFAMTQFQHEESVRRFHNILTRIGVMEELKKRGAAIGDVVRINDLEFDFVE